MKDVPCMNDEQLQSGIKLCVAVKRHPCLYDPLSSGYQMRNIVNAAWKTVAKECCDTAPNCRFRWKTIRSSFTRSFRKFGTSSQYYLYEHLDFLVPHMSLMEKNDESIGPVDEVNPLQLDKEDDSVSQITDDVSFTNDTDTTKSADEHFKTENIRRSSSIIDLDPDSNGEILSGSTAKAEENKNREASPPPLRPLSPKMPKLQQIQPITSPTNHSEDFRPLRIRKPPKRIYEADLDTSAPEIQVGKKPRRLMERRKSVGGLVLREFMYKNNITLDEPEKEPRKTSVSFQDEPEIEMPKKGVPFEKVKKLDGGNLEQKYQPKSTTDAEVFVKPEMLDASTLTDRMEITDDKSIQSNEMPRTLDDEFLDSLRPQIRVMNFRQKINFKQRVYLALMDVLDDAKNFPNDEDDIVELPPPLAKHFESTTNGELRLMRELVSLVKAAKVSSEVVDANRKVTIVRPASETNLSTPNRNDAGSPTPNGLEELLGDDESATSSPVVNSKSHDSLGIPRHILHKAVKVTGQSGGTLLAQNGEKRRIYRIYPKNQAPTGSGTPGSANNSPLSSSSSSSLGASGERMSGSHHQQNSSSAGTFFVTPSKPPQNRGPTYLGTVKPQNHISLSTQPLNKPSTAPMRGTAIQYPKIVSKTPGGAVTGGPSSSTSSSTMMPPITNRSPVLSGSTNSSSTSVMGQKISIATHVPSANIFRRRYSICGPAPNSSSSPSGMTGRVITSNGGGSGTPPSSSGQTGRQSLGLQPLQNIQQMRQGLQQHLQQMRQGMQPQHQQPFRLSSTPIRLASATSSSSSSSSTSRPPPTMQTIRPVPSSARPSATSSSTNTTTSSSSSSAASNNNSSPPFQILEPRSINSSFSNEVYLSRSNSPKNQDSNSGDGRPTSSTENDPLADGPTPDSFSHNANDIPVLETAGTIAADSFEPEFPKPPYIKDEPQD